MTKLNRILSIAIAAINAVTLAGAEKIELQAKTFSHEPILQPASGEGIQAIDNMVYPDDLEVSLVAEEPLFAHAVAFTFDEQGRIFIAESHRMGSSVIDVRAHQAMLETDLALRTVDERLDMINTLFDKPENFAIEQGLVRLLEDTDADGVMDKSSVYADGFNGKLDGIASGVLARNGNVWFTNIPSLIKFDGIDENGRAQTEEELLYGFGVRFGFYGHDLHGLAWGPDGKLYFSIGDRGIHVESKEGKTFSYPDTGSVFRCDPDGSNFEVFAYGLRNPQELVFDEYGNLFTGDNDCDNGDEERLVYVVEDGDSGWRVGHQHAPLGKAGMWMKENLWKPRHEGQPAYILPAICNTSDGPSGLTYYPGTGLQEKYKGHIFMCHFKGSLSSSSIDTYTLTPDGATFALDKRETFMERILPTDVTFGYDGKLYYSDWVAGWSKTGKGRIYSVATPDHANDKAAAGVAALFKDGFQDRPSNELQILLAHADQRVRLEAQFVLAERGNASIPIFTTVALDDSAPLLPRLHALWGLGQLADSKKAQKTIRALLASDQTELRAHAAKLCGDHGSKAEANKLIALLEDTSARVQFFAAQSLGKLAAGKAAEPLVELLRQNDDQDAYIRHAAYVALAKIDDKAVLQAAAKDPSKAVRLGALLAYRRLGSAEVAALLSDEDPFIVLEAARAINGEDIEGAYGPLAALIDSPAAKSDELLAYRVLNANFRLGEESNAQALIDYASNANIDDALRSEAIQHIAAWPSPPQRDRVVGLYRPMDSRPSTYATKALKPLVISLMQDPSGLVQEGVIKAISSLKMMEAADDLHAIVSNPNAQIPARVAALATLDTFEDPRLGELTELASQSEHEELRQAALPVVARLSPEKAAPVLRNIIASGSAEEKQNAFQALEKMEDPVAATILVESIDKLEAGRIPIAAHLELITAAEASQADAVKKKLLERNARLAATGDPLAPYEYSLHGGDRRAGRTVFNENPAMACVRCHQVNGIGGEAGPDLTGLARTNNPTQILEAIIKPNATIAPGFETAIVTKTDGSSVTGTVLDRGEAALKLRLPDSTETEIAKSDIANSVSLPSSMPEVFQTLLKPHELRDLMAYLKSLRGGPVNESH